MVILFINQAYNLSFHQKLESIQYNAALAVIRAIRGSSKEKLHQELSLRVSLTAIMVKETAVFIKFTIHKFLVI